MNTLNTAVKLAIKGDSAGAVRSLRSFDRSVQASERGVRRWGKAGKLAAAGLAAVGGLAVGAFYAVSKAVKGALGATGSWFKLLVQLRRQTGGTTEEVSLLAGQMRLSGVEMNSASKGLVLLNRNLYAAGQGGKAQAEAFRALGVDIRDSHGHMRTMADLLPEIRDRISKMEDPTARTALVMKLFGRGGAEMLPWLTKSRDEIDSYTKSIKDLGVFTERDMATFSKFRGDQRLMSYFFDMVKVKAGLFAMTMINKVWPALRSAAAEWFPKLKAAGEAVFGFFSEHKDSIAGPLKWIMNNGKVVGEVFAGIWLAAMGPIGKILAVITETKAFLDWVRGQDKKKNPTAATPQVRDAVGIMARAGMKISGSDLARSLATFGLGKESDAQNIKKRIAAALWIEPAAIKSIKDASRAIIDLQAARANVKTLEAAHILKPGDAQKVLGAVDLIEQGTKQRLTRLSLDAGKQGAKAAKNLSDPINRLKLFVPGIEGAAAEGTKAGKEAREAIQAELRKKLQASIGVSVGVNFGTGAGLGDGGQSLGGTLNAMRAVSVARQQIGDSYAIGATGPDVFDCSGLVKYVYNRSGLPGFPTYTGNQWVLGRQVPNSQVRPGDQIFMRTGIPQWTDSFGWGHTGIAVGGGMMVHASSPRTGVILSPIGAGYPWAARRHFARDGADFVAKVPTWILAGEAGKEHVKVTPAPVGRGIGGDGVSLSLTVNVAGSVYAEDLEQRIYEAGLDAAQEVFADSVRAARRRARGAV